MDYISPGSSVHGILQARILEWVAIPSSGNLPDPGIKPGSPALQADALPSEPPGEPQDHFTSNKRGVILETTQENMNSCEFHFYQKITSEYSIPLPSPP